MNHPLKKNHTIVQERLEDGISQSAIAREFSVKRQAVHGYANKHFPELLKPGTCLKCGKSLEHKRLGAKYCCRYCGEQKRYHDRKGENNENR